MNLTLTRASLALALLAVPIFEAGCQDSGTAAAGRAISSVGCEGCTVLQGGTVFDGSRAGVGVVVIEGDRVKDVVFGDPLIAAGEVIDVRGKTVLPGLIDLHVHLLSNASPIGDYSEAPHPDDHHKAMLRAGVTSYLDLGSPEHAIFEYRSRVAAGAALGPRVFAVGPLLTPTGGHPCYSGSPPGDFCVFVNTPAEAGPAVAALMPKQPDLVKIVIEAGQSKPLPRMTAETVAGIVSAAQPKGKKVIAHISSATDASDALDAGVRLFAHIPSEEVISPALAQRMAETGTVVVPTIAVMDGFYRVSHEDLAGLDDPALAADVPQDVLDALHDPKKRTRMTTPSYKAMTAAWRKNAMANLTILKEAGVTLATGTDAGNPAVFHGLAMQRELSLYVDAGISPKEALTAATRNAADVLGRPDLGRLERGALADVIVVGGDALSDIGAVGRVERVYRGGLLVDRDALALPNGTSLAIHPTTGVASGGTCLSGADCQSGLVCDADLTCAPKCHGFSGCKSGSSCLPLGTSSNDGACFEGDGCDPLAQDCDNDAACVPLGNAATACWYAGTAIAGKPCDPGGLCAAGMVCNFGTNRCKAICDPKGNTGAPCPLGKSCKDYSAVVGVSLGQCE